jgi:hypothetical protein
LVLAQQPAPVCAYNRSAKLRINKVRGDIVTLGGIFFDPAPAAAR